MRRRRGTSTRTSYLNSVFPLLRARLPTEGAMSYKYEICLGESARKDGWIGSTGTAKPFAILVEIIGALWAPHTSLTFDSCVPCYGSVVWMGES